ncbi:MAG: response regulator transcription factor [Candidatus Gastranaerophilales bacterium]|nr:response regulator transcription factor [Candidatus Gastranaerophilales bacterium]
MINGSIAKILVVDDHPKYLADVLPTFGYDVAVASDGLQALQILSDKDHGVNLIILDVMMPNLDGFETLKIIRTKPELESVPVIMLTAVDTEQKQIFGLKFGADDYIVKPFSLPNLLARIEAVLRRVNIAKKADTQSISQKVNVELNADKPIVPLSQREIDILKCAALGNNNEVIAQKLCVKSATVKTHMTRIFKKLNVKSRTQAILVAMQMNIIQ